MREIARDMVAFNDEGEPGALRYNVYVNDDETRVTLLEAFLDSEACRFHGERFAGGQFFGEVLERTDGAPLAQRQRTSRTGLLRQGLRSNVLVLWVAFITQ